MISIFITHQKGIKAALGWCADFGDVADIPLTWNEWISVVPYRGSCHYRARESPGENIPNACHDTKDEYIPGVPMACVE